MNPSDDKYVCATPRTDALAERCVGDGSPMSYVRAIDLCRQLERELAAVICPECGAGVNNKCDPSALAANCPQRAEVSSTVAPDDLPAIKTILQGCCDRDWKDETLYQTAMIVCNAIYWRDREIANLKHDIEKAQANHSADLSARVEPLIGYTPCKAHEGMSWTMTLNSGYHQPAITKCPICEPPK